MRLTEFLDNGLAILWARWYLRRVTHLGQRVRLWGRPAVRNVGGELIIGDRAVLLSTVATLELIAEGGRLEIGENSFINYGCSIAATQLVQIGANCKIGKQSIIIDNNFHHLEPERRNIRPPSAPTVLEPSVWLGARVIVLPGVTIGTGSVIGAGSVVTKNIPPRSLAAGIPAKVVRSF
jgi:maltose O-acetyltransferase